MGLLDLWNNLFSAKVGTSHSTKRKRKKKLPAKSVKRTQRETKQAQKKLKKSSIKRHPKLVIRKPKAGKKITSVKTHKYVKKSFSHSGIKTIKKASRYDNKLDKKPKEKLIGIVTHYFGKVYAGVIKLKAPLKTGDRIHIKGAHDDFIQVVNSMQINRENISSAGKGKEVGVKVIKPVHANDKVYLIKE